MGEEVGVLLQVIEDKRSELMDFCYWYGVVCLAPFGSAARDDFNAGRNDSGFSVRFAPINPSVYAEAYLGLLEGLFGRRVDLAEIGAVRNPYLRREIEERQEILSLCRDLSQPEGIEA